MLCIMWRIWCHWRQVSISIADGGGIEQKREEEKRVYGDKKIRRNGEYWKVNSMALVSSQDHKPNSTTLARTFHLRMDSEAMENPLF